MISKEGTTRETWIDATRGIACILVLLGHLLQGLEKVRSYRTRGCIHGLSISFIFFMYRFFLFAVGIYIRRKEGFQHGKPEELTYWKRQLTWEFPIWCSV